MAKNRLSRKKLKVWFEEILDKNSIESKMADGRLSSYAGREFYQGYQEAVADIYWALWGGMFDKEG